MTDNAWQIQSQLVADDDALIAKVLSVHQTLLEQQFSDDLLINRKLGIHLRSFRHLGDWRVFLLLPPWMLSRLLFPKADPGITVPKSWSIENRSTKPYE